MNSRRYDANRVTVDWNRLYIDMVLEKKLSKKLLGFGVFGRTFFRPKKSTPKIAFGGFKGMKSSVDSNLNAPLNWMDHIEWSKMTIFGHFFILDYRRQEGKESEGKDSIFTC